MLQGSCLCQKVCYEVKAIGAIVHCHCVTCRKAHGAAFSSVAAVADNDFELLRGHELLNGYESSAGKTRYFCSNCGSQIFAKREQTHHIILRLGTLDSDPKASESAHIWLSQKAPWYHLHTHLAEYDEFELP